MQETTQVFEEKEKMKKEIVNCLFIFNDELKNFVTINGIKDFICTSQVNDLLKKTKERNYKHYIILRMMFETGLKPSELTNLLLSDIDFTKEKISISSHREMDDVDAWSLKTSRQRREMKIKEDLSNAIELFTKKNEKSSKYLFQSTRGIKYNNMSILNVIKYAARRLQVPNQEINFNMIRRTYALSEILGRTKIVDLARNLSHKNIETCLKYLFDCRINKESGFIYKTIR